MPPIIRFGFKDIVDLNEDLRQSPKALQVVIRKVLSLHLKKLRNSLRSRVPNKIRSELASSVRKSKRIQDATWSILGFMRNKRTDAQSAILVNVFQKGFAETGARGRYGHRNAENIWVPLPAAGFGDAGISPSQFFTLPNTFIGKSKAGNKIAFQRRDGALWPLFVLKQRVRAPGHPIDFASEAEAELPETIEDIKETIGAVLAARGAVVRQAQDG